MVPLSVLNHDKSLLLRLHAIANVPTPFTEQRQFIVPPDPHYSGTASQSDDLDSLFARPPSTHGVIVKQPAGRSL